jgi:hypothetical protein
MSSGNRISYAGCCIDYYKYDSGKNKIITTGMERKKECEGAIQRAYWLRGRKINSGRDRTRQRQSKSAAGPLSLSADLAVLGLKRSVDSNHGVLGSHPGQILALYRRKVQ